MNENYLRFVDEAKKFACGIYKNVPGALVPKPTDAGYKAIWDDLCYEPPPSSLPGLPPPPQSQVPGGQCDAPYRYVAEISYINTDFTPPKEIVTSSAVGGFTKILGYSFGDLNGQKRLFIQTEAYNGDYREKIVPTWTGDIRFSPTMLNFSVFRTDGGVDNCGSSPKKFPPAPPPPPDGYNSPPTVIINNDGDEYKFIFNLQPPTIQKYPDDPLPPITINVGGDDNDLNFDIDFNFGGDISINPPGGGGGNLPSGFAPKFANLGDGLAGVSGGVSKLEDGFGFSFNPPNFVDSPEVNKEEEQIEGGGKEEDDKEGLLGVLVELTKLPTDVQFGTPNINFAGWFTFLVQSGYAPREPINFERGYFIAPPGATGYALTFTKGAEGRVTVYTRDN